MNILVTNIVIQIALLCGPSQSCQTYYAKCYSDATNNSIDAILLQCIIDRPLSSSGKEKGKVNGKDKS